MPKNKSSKDSESKQDSCDVTRREVLKKAAYIPPALVTLGTLTPLNSSADIGSPPYCPPGWRLEGNVCVRDDP